MDVLSLIAGLAFQMNLKANWSFLIYRVNLEFPDCQDTQEDKDQRYLHRYMYC